MSRHVLTDCREFAPINCVKFPLPLILALATAALLLNACTTLANRRDLYAPAKVEGPYNDMLAHHTVTHTAAQLHH